MSALISLSSTESSMVSLILFICSLKIKHARAMLRVSDMCSVQPRACHWQGHKTRFGENLRVTLHATAFPSPLRTSLGLSSCFIQFFLDLISISSRYHLLFHQFHLLSFLYSLTQWLEMIICLYILLLNHQTSVILLLVIIVAIY